MSASLTASPPKHLGALLALMAIAQRRELLGSPSKDDSNLSEANREHRKAQRIARYAGTNRHAKGVGHSPSTPAIPKPERVAFRRSILGELSRRQRADVQRFGEDAVVDLLAEEAA